MANMSDYFKSLAKEIQDRYIEKLKIVGNVMDPYTLSPKTGSGNPSDFPELSYYDIVNYLVFAKSAYTQQYFKAYKSLEAYNIFTCNWVRLLLAYNVVGSNYVVMLGKVTHSQRLNLQPVKLWIIISKSGEVSSAHCDCVAGLGECCSHVGAVLFATEHSVRNKETTSVTDKKAYWKLPPKLERDANRVRDVDYSAGIKKFKKFSDLQHRVSVQNDSVKEPTSDELDMLYKNLSNIPEVSVCLTLKEPYCYDIINQLKEQEATILCNLFSEQHQKLSLEELQNVSKTISLSITAEECAEIEQKTRQQHKSQIWFSHRAGRITASRFKAICRTNAAKPSLSLIKSICYPSSMTFKSKQTMYGCYHEKDALESYKLKMCSQHTDFTLHNAGLVINPKYPHFGASPDSFVNCQCCGKGLVEVKCPYCIQDISVGEAVDLKQFCLKRKKDEPNNLHLDPNHQYFFQIQMQIALSERQYCDFVIWSSNSLFIERIKLNKKFWSTHSDRATSMFRNVILPELLGKAFTVKTIVL